MSACIFKKQNLLSKLLSSPVIGTKSSSFQSWAGCCKSWGLIGFFIPVVSSMVRIRCLRLLIVLINHRAWSSRTDVGIEIEMFLRNKPADSRYLNSSDNDYTWAPKIRIRVLPILLTIRPIEKWECDRACLIISSVSFLATATTKLQMGGYITLAFLYWCFIFSPRGNRKGSNACINHI